MTIQKILSLLRQNRLKEAQDGCIHLLNQNQTPELWHILSIIAIKTKNYSNAIELINESLRLEADNPLFINTLAEANRLKGEYKKAIELYDKAFSIESNPDFLYNKSLAQKANGELEAAKSTLKKAIVIKNDSDYLFNLANIYRDEDDFEQAIYYYKKALSIKSSDDILHNLASSYKNLGLYDNALKCLESIKNKDFTTHFNIGNVYRAIKNPTLARKEYEKSLKLNPNFLEASLNLAFTHLEELNLKEGFLRYEDRLHFLPKAIRFDTPSLSFIYGKRCAIVAEQGFGDTIMFYRFIQLLDKKNINYQLFVQESLTKILPNSKKLEELNTENYDFIIPLGSLPFLLDIGIKEIKQTSPYIFVEKKNKLDIKNGVAIFFASNPLNSEYKKKSIDPKLLVEKLKNIPEITLYSIQKEGIDSDIKGVIDLSHNIHSFRDSAELISSMDLVIGIDSALAHLSGAMGKRCLLLLPYESDWRWGTIGDKTIWYDSIKIFRQEHPNNWEQPLEGVVKELSLLKK